jgi:hypothetical protein
MVIYKLRQPLCDSWQRLTLSLALSSDPELSLWVGGLKSEMTKTIFFRVYNKYYLATIISLRGTGVCGTASNDML